jgi:hypothetical protein
VDFWGLNIYRGVTFGNVHPMVFDHSQTHVLLHWNGRRRSTFLDILTARKMKPCRRRSITASERDHDQPSALNLSGICVGGTVFEWNDEWWKVRLKTAVSSMRRKTWAITAVRRMVSRTKNGLPSLRSIAASGNRI